MRRRASQIWLAMPYALPYDVRPDKNGELWTGGMSNDRVTRYDPKSGQEIDYLLRGLDTGARIEYDPALVVTHPDKRVSPSARRSLAWRLRLRFQLCCAGYPISP